MNAKFVDIVCVRVCIKKKEKKTAKVRTFGDEGQTWRPGGGDAMFALGVIFGVDALLEETSN